MRAQLATQNVSGEGWSKFGRRIRALSLNHCRKQSRRGVQQVSAADTHSADLNQQKISACMGNSPERRHSIDIHQTSVFVVCMQPVAAGLDHVGVQAQRSNPLHDGLSVQVAMTGLRGWRLPATPALASAAALLVVGALPGWGRTPSDVPFPSPESLRQVQLAALACARKTGALPQRAAEDTPGCKSAPRCWCRVPNFAAATSPSRRSPERRATSTSRYTSTA